LVPLSSASTTNLLVLTFRTNSWLCLNRLRSLSSKQQLQKTWRCCIVAGCHFG
ncbi:hypothetical protein IW145_005947, partial [Coemansia sp. RSA 521]